MIHPYDSRHLRGPDLRPTPPNGRRSPLVASRTRTVLSPPVSKDVYTGVRPVEQGEGDSVVAAFTRASDALAAALDVQCAFHSEEWPEGASLRLRIAVHTAEAQRRDEGNYFGQPVENGLASCVFLPSRSSGPPSSVPPGRR